MRSRVPPEAHVFYVQQYLDGDPAKIYINLRRAQIGLTLKAIAPACGFDPPPG